MNTNITRDEHITKFYYDRICAAVELFEDSEVINKDIYRKVLSCLPSDLAARLRLVPDMNLGSRLAHLEELCRIMTTEMPVGHVVNYSLVSVEGSSRVVPVDCDLILINEDTSNLVFVDVTSSSNKNILRKKEAILSQTIEINEVKNAEWCIHRFKPVVRAVDIEGTFTSTEPGTLGIKLMDCVATSSQKIQQDFLSKCKDVYLATCTELSRMDNDKAPGDYKDFDPSEELLQSSLRLIGKQADRESFEFIKDCAQEDSTYFPYLDGIKTLMKNARQFKAVVPVPGAESLPDRGIREKLASLSDDPLAKCLHAAMHTDFVAALDDSLDIRILDEFPITDSNNLFAEPSQYLVACKQKKGHVFTIKFSRSFVDSKLKRILDKGGEKKDKAFSRPSPREEGAEVDRYVNTAIDMYEQDTAYFQSLATSKATEDIWKKILTISALSSNDLNNFGRSTHSLIDSTVTTIQSTYAGACVSHMYEINKSILASLKTSPSDNSYYVGSNGALDSVTIVKMSSTLDSFKRCAYSVIMRPQRVVNNRHTRFVGSYTNDVFRTSFYSSDPNQLSYALRVPFIWVSLATWELENNMVNGAIAGGVVPRVLTDSLFATLNNRDQFAQASEQVRYFYMGAIGYGGSAPDITDKTTFMSTRHPWEVVYLLRMYKLSASLCSISCAGALGKLEDPSTKELAVAFPHSQFPSKSFSQTISSMYICNVYNKFRAFHEVSEAVCFMALVDEINIYKDRISEDPNAVAGLSPFCTATFDGSMESFYAYLYDPNFISEEVNFAVSLAQIKSRRYSGSACFIIGTFASSAVPSDSMSEAIHEKLNKAPIEACTMRGSMDEGTSTAEHQGIRAASAVLEAMMRQNSTDPKSVNKSMIGAASLMDKIRETRPAFSIMSSVTQQFLDASVVYRFRVVQKDQKGHREISVLNFQFRVGAMLVETIARTLSSHFSDVDVCHNPNKDKIIEDMLASAHTRSARKGGVTCFDNSDQKRWGPNHNTNFFSYMFLPLLINDPGLFRLTLRVFDLTLDKRAKLPESLVDLITKKNVTRSNSLIIDKFINYALPKINSKVFEVNIGNTMCQGIYQDTSSLMHAGMTKAQDLVRSKATSAVLAEHLVTSDDKLSKYTIAFGQDRVKVVKMLHCITLRVGNLFNIVRSGPKSAFNFHIGELNSIFNKRGHMAVPSLKQRIAKVDIGMGVNHIEDYLSCLASAANYLASGGSYVGTITLSVLNLTLHTEQWLRWGFATADNFRRPVELGGFPVVEPISTILSGGIANFYQRCSDVLLPEQYSRVVVNSLLCPPEEVSMNEFSRVNPKTLVTGQSAKDLTIYKGTGPLGFFQMVKTDRKLSQFERRHGISTWLVPDEFATLKRDSSLASDFMFTIFRTTSVSTLDTNVGVNGFFVRMAEPWASFDRPCMRVSKHSPFFSLMGGTQEKFSHRDFNSELTKYSLTESHFLLRDLALSAKRHKEFEVMEAQMGVRMKDAQTLQYYLGSQEAETFNKSVVSPSIQNVTLRGHTASDSDSYMLAIIKTLAGDAARPLINDLKHVTTAYDSIDVAKPKSGIPLVDAIIQADNAVALYNKFVRKNTKMTLPNKVEDLRELCHEILNNKFTEMLGITLTGKIDLSEERARPYAYSNWYNNLVTVSEKFETSVANTILRGESPPAAVVGVNAARNIITKSDLFELTTPNTAPKTVLIEAPSRSAFISAIRTWISANVKIMLSRTTINSLISGRLSFAHDYYVGSGSFMRYTKDKYLTIRAGGIKGLHLIRTTVKHARGRKVMGYRHYFLFNQEVEGMPVEVELNDRFKEESWLLDLKESVDGKPAPASGMSKEVQRNRGVGKFIERKSDSERDFVVFNNLVPGKEFEIVPVNDSLCVMLQSHNLSIPLTYLSPTSVEEFQIGYTLTDHDLKAMTKAFVKVREMTNDFSRQFLHHNMKVRDALDFILVGSTVDTPEYVIRRVLEPVFGISPNGVQLDILRTFFIKHPKFGVGYSSHRFTQYLLNLGNRRENKFSYLTKTASGARVDLESEDWEVVSADEELLMLGESSPHEFRDCEQEDSNPSAAYAQPASEPGEEDPSGKEVEELELPGDWADEVIESCTQQHDISNLLVSSAAIAEDFLFDLDDEDSNLGEDLGVGSPPEKSHIVSNLTTARDISPSLSGGEFIEDVCADLFKNMGQDLLNQFNMDNLGLEEDQEEEAPQGGTLDALFKNILGGTFEAIEERKDQKLKSEKSGHTVSPTVESARPIIMFLKDWIETAGAAKQLGQGRDDYSNIASITKICLFLYEMRVLDYANPLQTHFKLDQVRLPVELSALAVVDTMYG
uniref:RNA-directed RNA polymerase L n=1 Tax=Nanning tick virus 3 TaxID=2972285 RepID=A0A9E8AAJ1_9VIRU|nr:MAG: RNA-dependent RNA polymerase [Nanning tick virus 3]